MTLFKGFRALILLAFFCCATLVMGAQPVHPESSENYTIDSSHTYALFQINHMGFSNQTGKWHATGTINFDEQNPQNSKTQITIDVAKLTTGVNKLDEHLLKADFFDVTQFPVATFVSEKIKMTGKNTADIEGILTLRGVSKPIILHAKLNKIGISPVTQKKTLGFSATAQLKRSDYGITAYLPALGDEVTLTIEGEANH